MWDLSNPDPLGIGLKERARRTQAERRRQDGEEYKAVLRDFPSAGLYGPARLPSGERIEHVARDQQWQGLFQALEESGASRVGFESGTGQNRINAKPVQSGSTPYSGREPSAAMTGLQQARPETPDLKQKRVNSQAANRTARQINPGLYGRGR